MQTQRLELRVLHPNQDCVGDHRRIQQGSCSQVLRYSKSALTLWPRTWREDRIFQARFLSISIFLQT